MSPRPPLPPFTEETACQKVQAAEDAWNTRDPERVAGAAVRRLSGQRWSAVGASPGSSTFRVQGWFPSGTAGRAGAGSQDPKACGAGV